MDTLTQIIVNMVKTTPNDVELGKKIRALVQEMGVQSINENKQILKG
jgi:hypothetical protein